MGLSASIVLIAIGAVLRWAVTATVSGTGRYVNAGTVGGAVTVATGATVSGLGSLNTLTTQSGAVVNPGSALGALSVNNLSLAAGSFLDIEASDAASALKRDSLTFNATSAFTGTGTVGIRLFSFNDATGVRGRLMRRRDDPGTWMEVYEGIADAVAFESALNEAAARTGAAALCGHRVTEIFVAA